MRLFERDLKSFEPEWPLYVAVETVGTFVIVIAALIVMVLV